MEPFTVTYRLTHNLGITNESIDAGKNSAIKKNFIESLENDNARIVYTDGMAEVMQQDKLLDNPGTTYITLVMPAPPESIKGSDGNINKAAIIIMESFNTDLTSIKIDGTTTKIKFEYTGTVHYAVPEKQQVNHYDVFTFVAKGDFGIGKLSHTYKNELARLCLDALNDKETVLYEKSSHTTDFNESLPDVLELPEFSHLVIMLSVPAGEASVDDSIAEDVDSHAMPYDINVFNAEGIFMPEKVVYDDGDGIKKLIVSLYYRSGI